MPSSCLDKLASELARMSREQVVATLQSLDCDFAIDFTKDFLNTLSLERLRHVALAACLHAHNQHLHPGHV